MTASVHMNPPAPEASTRRLSLMGRIRKAPFLSGCLVFVLIKLLYLVLGYRWGLNVRSLEGLSRLHFSNCYHGLRILEGNIPWLPLPPAVMTLAVLPKCHIFLMGSIVQTLISIAGGIMGALLAREISKGSWRAGLAALAAWAGSDAVSILGIGYMSEPLFHMQIFALLYFGIRWMREGDIRWRAATLLCVFAIQLSRYEGWMLVGLYFFCLGCLISDSRRHGLFPELKGLWEFQTPHYFILMGLIAVMPLAWLALNWLIRGNPLFFMECAKEVFKVNIHMSYVEKMRAYLEYLYLAWKAQPLVVFIAATVVTRPRILRGPAFVLVLTICFLAFFNYNCIMNETTAFAYPERLSVTLFICFCPLFGIMTDYFFRLIRSMKSLKKYASTLFFALIALLVLTGANHFRSRPSNLYQEMGMDIADFLREEIRNSPPEEGPLVLFDVTDADYSVVVFFIDMDSSRYRHYNKRDGVPMEDVLKKHPSIRYLLLNHTEENVKWVIDHKTYRHRISSSMWDLYEKRI